MQCMSCGAETPDTAAFCQECGVGLQPASGGATNAPATKQSVENPVLAVPRGAQVPVAPSAGYPRAELVSTSLFVLASIALVLGVVAAIAGAATYECQETFLSDCSDEGTTKAVYFFAILIGTIIYVLPNFALAYALRYLADLDRWRHSVG